MGTRSDYYIIEKEKIIFIGSYGWDGYPEGIPMDMELYKSKSKEEFIQKVHNIDNVILNKWPWPWGTSKITDFTYLFNKGKVLVNVYDENDEEIWVELEKYLSCEDKDKLSLLKLDFQFRWPDMTNIQEVDMGPSSGIIKLETSYNKDYTNKDE